VHILSGLIHNLKVLPVGIWKTRITFISEFDKPFGALLHQGAVRFPLHWFDCRLFPLVLHWSPFTQFQPECTLFSFDFQGLTLFCSLRFSKPDEQAAQLPPDEERCTFYSRDFGIGQQRRCKRPRKEGYKQCEHHVELRRKRAQKAKEGGAAVPAIEEPPVPEEQRCTYWAQQ
jgi:hypothetical protein